MRRLAIVMVALVTASCGGSPSASESQRPVHFSGLSGVVYGSGGDGAVMANQSDRDRESWAPFARYLAENGLRVLAFDYEARRLDLPTLFVTARSDPFSAADTGAVAEARRGGARRGGAQRVFLVGGSLGGAAVVAAAPTIRPPVDGVVSLSGETDIDALVGSHGLNHCRLRVGSGFHCCSSSPSRTRSFRPRRCGYLRPVSAARYASSSGPGDNTA